VDARSEFGDFLKTRRARLSPEQAGIVPFGERRRVPGLRREELAQLAGLSVTYLTRLEQGRAGNVSDQVLDALAAALRLDDDERIHLQTLVGGGHDPRWRPRTEDLRPSLRALVEGLTDVPAMLINQRADVLVWNDGARRLYAPDLSLDAPSRPDVRPNTSRRCFLHQPTRAIYADWRQVAHDNVAFLRLTATRYPDDRQLAELIGELTMKSPEFAAMWTQHPVQDAGYATRSFLHPEVGAMDLTEEVVILSDDPGLRMMLTSAEPGSPSQIALRRLLMP
jgi:transcriptional regulator with XRE-family HTH domain